MRSLISMVTFAFCLGVFHAAADPAAAFEFRDGDRVVWIGGTLVERMQVYGYVEAELTARFHRRGLTFRNLGWSGDNVWGDARAVFGSRAEGFERLVKDTREARPTVVMIAYGANEAYAGASGLDAFRDGLANLLRVLEPTGARLVLLSPHRCESLGRPLPDMARHNKNIALYRDAIREAADSGGHEFVDLFEGLMDFSGTVAARTAAGGQLPLTSNGIHLNQHGYFRLARFLAEHFDASSRGENGPAWEASFDLGKRTYDAVGLLVQDVQWRDDSLRFLAVADRLALPRPGRPAETGSRETVPGLRRLRVQGLPEGRYRVLAGEQGVTANHQELRRGIPVDFAAVEQAKELLAAIRKKNELYFHRYRPQNETYLFLFRKHEQGNNAAEIPQFDPLVAAHEERIAELAAPRRLVIDVRPITD